MLGPLTARQLQAPLFQGTASFYKTLSIDPVEHRLFAFPPVISSTLGFITTIRLVNDGSGLPDGGTQSFVEALPVAGSVTAGVVNAAAIDPGDGALVAVIDNKDTQHFEVCSLSLNQGVATFKPYTSVGAPATQYFAYWIFPVSAGSFVVQVGNSQYPLTLSGSSATWGAAQSPASNRSPRISMPDGAQPRTLGFAEDVYQPPPSTVMTIEPNVFERALPLGSWTVRAASGDVPPTLSASQATVSAPWGAYDAAGRRILAGVTHQYLLFGNPVTTYGLWSFDLNTNVWLKLKDDVGSLPLSSPPIVDPTQQQLVLNVHAGGFTLMSLRSGREGTMTSVSLYDSPSVPAPKAAAVLSDGRLVSSQGGLLYVLSPSAPVWTRLSKAFLPDTSINGHSLSFDPQTGKLLLFGGAFGGQSSAKLYHAALDGAALPEIVPAAGSTVARSEHAALAHRGVLYVAGGTGVSDVSAFDLGTSTWRKLGDLPQARTRAALQVVGNELWVIGGVSSAFVGIPSIVAFDLTTGAQRMVTVDNAWPSSNGNFWVSAPLGDGIVVVDSDNRVDNSSNQLWTLDPIPSGGAHWTNAADPHVHDQALYELVGAAGDRHQAYFVGGHLWQLHR